MIKKFSLIILVIIILTTFLFTGCSSKQSEETKEGEANKITIVDTLGREVTLDEQAKKVIAIGPGALRLYCYVGTVDKLVGVEQIEKKYAMGRPYALANPSLNDLNVIGPGGPDTSPDAEKILAANPDVIFTTYAYDKATADNLQSKTGIPVVALSYGKTSIFDQAIYKSIESIGKAIGDEERASKVVEFIDGCKEDLNNRTKDIDDKEKLKTYIGALSYKGIHGIESTWVNYGLFDAVNANNVADEIDKAGHIMIDKEKLIEWNPQKIFIDYGGLELVKEDYTKNPDFYKTISAFKDGEVYSQLPYNFYSTNIGTAIADAYFIGKVLYPEKFNDIEPDKKADEIYKFLVGKEVYNQMVKDFGEFSNISLEK